MQVEARTELACKFVSQPALSKITLCSLGAIGIVRRRSDRKFPSMDAPLGHEQNADQIAYWNGPGGQRWADRQQAQDILLKPIADALVDRAAPKSGERIIDVGCGSGATAIAFAQKVAPSGHVLGVDVSGPMLARARQTAPGELPVDFELADATVYPFAPASFDLLVSRFGVMFFAEPVLSFANLRKAMKPSGRLAFACWREPRENPFFMVPLQAVYQHAPKLPPQGPEDPGPFSLASEARVNRILDEAGFKAIAMQPCDFALDVAIGRGLDTAVQSALEIGPAARALAEQPLEVIAAATHSIREALTPFVRGQTVPLPAAIWIVTATAS
jgi:SAM-dependent methyltransferase